MLLELSESKWREESVNKKWSDIYEDTAYKNITNCTNVRKFQITGEKLKTELEGQSPN
jgi:hypothetical protein